MLLEKGIIFCSSAALSPLMNHSQHVFSVAELAAARTVLEGCFAGGG
ncbi:MAG: hypothetical protein ACTFAK_04330 [Candidatus Electronema sp. VV]